MERVPSTETGSGDTKVGVAPPEATLSDWGPRGAPPFRLRPSLCQDGTRRGSRFHLAAEEFCLLTVKAMCWPAIWLTICVIGVAINHIASFSYLSFTLSVLLSFGAYRALINTLINKTLVFVLWVYLNVFILSWPVYYSLGLIFLKSFRVNALHYPLCTLTSLPAIYLLARKCARPSDSLRLKSWFVPAVYLHILSIILVSLRGVSFSLRTLSYDYHFETHYSHEYDEMHITANIGLLAVELFALLYLECQTSKRDVATGQLFGAYTMVLHAHQYTSDILRRPVMLVFFVHIFLQVMMTSGLRALVSAILVALIPYLYREKLAADLVMSRRMYTSLLLDNSEVYNLHSTSVRSDFGTRPIPEVPSHRVHTHPTSAKSRTNGAAFMDSFASANGFTVFQESMSTADIRNNRNGSRLWYYAKDVNIQPSYHSPASGDLVCMVDVDYYVDMNRWLCEHFNPTMLFTLVPQHAAHTGPDYQYTFDNDGFIKYDIAGGATYRHQLWNYGYDTITVHHYNDYLDELTVAVYSIDRRALGEERQLVLLLPMRRWVGTFASLAKLALEHHYLERLDVVHNNHAVVKTVGEHGSIVSIAPLGAYSSVDLKQNIYDTLVSAVKATRHELTVGAIQAHVKDFAQSILIAKYFQTIDGYHPVAKVYPVPDYVNGYQFDVGNFIEPAKCKMERIMPPLFDGAISPASNPASEKRAIDGRINLVKANVLRHTVQMDRMMEEFVSHLIPSHSSQTLHPLDLDTVWERQDRKAQRSLILRSFTDFFKERIESFLKAESYQKPADPRVISTIHPKTKVAYSQVLYALNDSAFVKSQPWYAFGKKPQEIAQRVAEICSKATSVINTDFSRFDGHYSNLLRDLERRILMRAFAPEHHPHIVELHEKQYKQKGVGKFGTKYDTDYTRASGSPETSCFNTLSNAFIAYLALRKQLDSDRAYAALGIYGGDDGFTADINPHTYQLAASEVGQVLTAEVVKRGDLGVKFLARIYSPSVWNGDTNSCCDIVRQVTKLHLATIVPGLTHTQRVILKARSFALSDANTPIIGDFSNWVLAHTEGVEVNVNHEVKHLVEKYDVTDGNQYPNENIGDWMFEVMRRDLPNFDYTGFTMWLASHPFDQLPIMPSWNPRTEFKVTEPMIIRGELVVPEVKDEKKEVKDTKEDKEIPFQPLIIDLKKKSNNAKAIVTRPQSKKVESTPEQRKAAYERLKAEKQANGTWIDRPPETRAQTMARKMRNGTWKDRK